MLEYYFSFKSDLLNINNFFFYNSEIRLSWWTNLVEEQRDAQLAESERIVGGLFESSSDKSSNAPCAPSLSMASPEVAFVSILRYGMLALELLPENSSAGKKNYEKSLKIEPSYILFVGMIIFTDGVFGTTDAGTLEVLLTQLRHNTIGCSFVQVLLTNVYLISKVFFSICE